MAGNQVEPGVLPRSSFEEIQVGEHPHRHCRTEPVGVSKPV